jgi:hypothetical protein
MRSRIRRLFVVVIAATIVTALAAASALAAPLTIPPGVTSVSNPDGWRGGWGSSLYPDYALSMPAGSMFWYLVDRNPATVVTTVSGTPFSPVAGGTLFSGTLDIEGTYNYAPSGSIDGTWTLHVLPSTYASGVVTYGAQIDVPVGIDRTPPLPVTGVLLRPDGSAIAGTSVVGRGTRATVSWSGLDYDALSGTAYYSVYVDGVVRLSGPNFLPSTDPPYWYDPLYPLPYQTTFDDLTPGRHEIAVTATDLALNESPKTTAVIWCDPDTPTIKFTRTETIGGLTVEVPLNRAACGRYISFACTAADLGGIAYVDWYIDGVPAGRSYGSPYTGSLDFAAFGLGWHQIGARVTDMAGRTATAYTGITVTDLTTPRITRVTDSPDPFYPVIRNGYKDDSIVRFTLSESAMVWLLVYDSAGNKVRLVTDTWRRRGRRSIKWNGLKDDGTMAPDGTYTIYVGADDGAGNVGWSVPRTTRLRSFIVKRLGRNRVKLIFK